jgi:type I restriction enzyme S subunit
MKKQKNIPKLRFPEFEGEWEKKMINDTCTIVGGGTPESGKDEFWDGDIQWFTPTEIKMDYVSKSERTITELGLKKSSARLLPKGTILLTSRATIGEVAIALNECATNQGFQSLIVNKSYNNLFIFNWIKDNRHQFVRRANGSTFLEISKSEIGKITICTPPLPEQQKIASFFTAIDQKIFQLKRKLTLLELYKKGVMQKIFSQEIRFKDDNGREFPKWEKKRLGDISNKKASTISANTIEENFGDYPIYGATGFLKNVDFFLEENDYISIVKDGAGVGRLLYCEGNSSVLGTLDIIRPKKGINTYFLYLLLSQIDFTKFITGSTIPHIYYKDYSKNSLLMPCQKEQTKIANFLSVIDDKINHTQKQIEKAEVWKKGLMQQMFV